MARQVPFEVEGLLLEKPNGVALSCSEKVKKMQSSTHETLKNMQEDGLRFV